MLAQRFDDAERRRSERLDRRSLESLQLEKLNRLLAFAVKECSFYRDKLRGVALPLESLAQVSDLPTTSKDELLPEGDGAPVNLTWPVERYVRFHQTSGTHGRPLAVYDAAEDWQWWLDCWQYVLDAADVTVGDRALLAFSFGPFIGFWTAHDALLARGTLSIPGGGMSTAARLDLIRRTGATVLLATPTYALRMAEVAAELNVDLTDLPVRTIIVAGEPGGSVESIRRRIEVAWQARVVDHAGASEVGAWGYADRRQRGVHVIETEFLAEFASVETGAAATHGQLAHLLLTPLGRNGMPVIRYRTGDLVRPVWLDDSENRFVLLDGGVLGRADDMMVIRGVNVFPAAVEQILRSFPEVIEYRLTATRQGAMDQLVVEVEDRLECPRRIADELQLRLGLRIEVRLTAAGSLPRFEGKGRRFIDQRT